MYKAIKDIGGYRIGDVVPDLKAELWLKMYKIPQVEKVEEVEKKVPNGNKPLEEPKKKVDKNLDEKKDSLNNILEDYLGRNQSVVKKNILEDNLNENQLKELLKIEESEKRRPLVISTLKQRLKN